MPRRGGRRVSAGGTRDALAAGEKCALLVRNSHIFSAAVREILEEGLLQESTRLPLSLSQFHLLRLVSLDSFHQVGEVADLLGVSAPATTRNVDKLEGLGLVVRKPARGDRRARRLAVSSKGRRLVERCEKRQAARLSPVLTRFGREEVERFSEMLERMALSLLAEDGGTGACLRCSAYVEADCAVGRLRGICPYRVSRPPAHPSGGRASAVNACRS